MNKNQTIGSLLLIIGAGLGILAYAHRPPDGFMDALTRQAGSWFFQPNAYYGILFIAALFVIGGILRLVMKPKPSADSAKNSG